MSDETPNEDASAELGDDNDFDIDLDGGAWRLPSFWRRMAERVLPFMFKPCPFGSRHWIWEELCTCGYGMVFKSGPEAKWHGGVLDLRNLQELQLCGVCNPDQSEFNHQWALTTEEEQVIQAWRQYREANLDHFGKEHPYRYELSVSCNGTREPLLTYTQGPVGLSGSRGMFSDTVKLAKGSGHKPN